MATFNVYSISLFSFTESSSVDNYRYFSSKLKAINYYNSHGYRLQPIDDVDKVLERVTMYNAKTKCYIYISKCEVD